MDIAKHVDGYVRKSVVSMPQTSAPFLLHYLCFRLIDTLLLFSKMKWLRMVILGSVTTLSQSWS